jgi:hypothetical protein
MSESRDKQKRNRLVIALVMLTLLVFSCMLGLPVLIFGIKFGWPRIRNQFYQGPVPLGDSDNGAR